MMAYVGRDRGAQRSADETGDDLADAGMSRRSLLAGALGVVGIAGLTRVPTIAGTSPSVGKWTTPPSQSVFNVQSFGATGDGTTDDTAAIRLALAAAQGAVTVGVPGAAVYFPEGEYVISDTITLDRFSGALFGDGQGQSPAYGPQPGHATVIRWDGSGPNAMIEIVDSAALKIHDLRLEGKSTDPPTYAIEFQSAGGDKGCNHFCTVEDVTIGQFPWSSQGTNVGDVQTCIGFTGMDANNDQFHFNRLRLSYPTDFGIFLPNTQSIWGSITDCCFDHCGIAGLGTNADTTLFNCSFNACTTDIRTGVEDGDADAPNVQVVGWFSENSRRMAAITPNTKLTVRGGVVQCGAIESGSGALIDAYPSDSQSISLHNVTFTQLRYPRKARITFGPSSPTHVGRVFITVDQCHGIRPIQLELKGAMWARSRGATSRAVVEWQSMDGLDSDSKYLYQFRNELAPSGRGTRPRLNRRVWDHPLAGHR
jgi:Pectate lyase superfamily protein